MSLAGLPIDPREHKPDPSVEWPADEDIRLARVVGRVLLVSAVLWLIVALVIAWSFR